MAETDAPPDALAADGDPPWRSAFVESIAERDGLVLATDFDGTLAPIVADPDAATIRTDARAALATLADRPDTSVAVVSGRGLADLRDRVDVDGIAYAGNHGLEVDLGDETFTHPEAAAAADEIAALVRRLRADLSDVDGVAVEDKDLSATVHYRRADDAAAERARDRVRRLAEDRDAVEVTTGKQILELRPAVEWDKGRAMEWLLDALDVDPAETPAVYLGDDETDEDAFRALEDVGTGILVGDSRPSAARYRLADPAAVADLLGWLADR